MTDTIVVQERGQHITLDNQPTANVANSGTSHDAVFSETVIREQMAQSSDSVEEEPAHVG